MVEVKATVTSRVRLEQPGESPLRRGGYLPKPWSPLQRNTPPHFGAEASLTQDQSYTTPRWTSDGTQKNKNPCGLPVWCYGDVACIISILQTSSLVCLLQTDSAPCNVVQISGRNPFCGAGIWNVGDNGQIDVRLSEWTHGVDRRQLGEGQPVGLRDVDHVQTPSVRGSPALIEMRQTGRVFSRAFTPARA